MAKFSWLMREGGRLACSVLAGAMPMANYFITGKVFYFVYTSARHLLEGLRVCSILFQAVFTICCC